jgi:pimeloyl-ACP methyl ester carboxylesterase
MDAMNTFILIHGAWLSAGIWEQITTRLREVGHGVLTPDLPGNGRHAMPSDEVSLQTYVDAIDALVRTHPEVIMVGHSMAGIILSSVAESMPENISHLVYLAAFMLPSDTSIMSFQAKYRAGKRGEQRANSGAVHYFLRFSLDKTFSTLNPSFVPEKLCNTCNESDTKMLLQHLAPQPTQPRRDLVHVTESRWGHVPRTYIKTLQDNAVPLALQEAMIAQSPGTRLAEVDSDHSPFYSKPERLTHILLRIASK